MTKKYTVTLTEKQLNAIADACDLLQRVQLGQWQEIQDSLPLRFPVEYDQFHRDIRLIGEILSQHMLDGINGVSSSLGIGHSSLPESNGILYDLYKVIRRKLALEKLIEDGKIRHENVSRNELPIYIQYDEVHSWGGEPLMTIEQIKDESP